MISYAMTDEHGAVVIYEVSELDTEKMAKVIDFVKLNHATGGSLSFDNFNRIMSKYGVEYLPRPGIGLKL
ncbi:hypothetical protein HNP86_001791 [Methanococcus maripaludis]|uniref:Uncharacterized protein n=1 Tax=Methanococcus maripaludis TaxID=39152 RepID=A0A7J9NVC3_METMI|nr:hypothetical protein [Methanococcus maripaludis]MBA2851632.1 hypothetical protein [Methanococcus maripaludis]